MAQVCGGTTYDIVWGYKLASALRVVRSAADLWSARGADAMRAEELLAVLFRIFSDNWLGGIECEARGLAGWRPLVSSTLAEGRKLNPKAPVEAVERAIEGVADELRFAVGRWAEGDPERPATEHVLNVVVNVLFKGGLVLRPANPRLPLTLDREAIST